MSREPLLRSGPPRYPFRLILGPRAAGWDRREIVARRAAAKRPLLFVAAAFATRSARGRAPVAERLGLPTRIADGEGCLPADIRRYRNDGFGTRCKPYAREADVILAPGHVAETDQVPGTSAHRMSGPRSSHIDIERMKSSQFPVAPGGR